MSLNILSYSRIIISLNVMSYCKVVATIWTQIDGESYTCNWVGTQFELDETSE